MMRRLILLIVTFVIPALPAMAEFYKLEDVKRVDQDLYRNGNLYQLLANSYAHATAGSIRRLSPRDFSNSPTTASRCSNARAAFISM